MLVLTARAPHGPAGVLVVSMPTLNAGWRDRAWPGWRPAGEGRRESAARLNAGLRTISRVVIDPRFRGMGLAAALVREYLRRPLTGRTEAIAAMGRFCPFFARAGMREIGPVEGSHAARLACRLAREGHEPSAWLERGAAERAAGHDPALVLRLRAWARASRGTRRWAGVEPGELLVRTALRLEARPIAYAWP